MHHWLRGMDGTGRPWSQCYLWIV